MAAVNFDNLVIDRVVDAWFENSDLELLAVLDQVQNLSVNVTSETKDKTDATGALIKRYYTAKQAEVSGENAVFSLNLLGIQTGTGVKKDTEVEAPRILMVRKTDSPITLPDTPKDGTLMVYGTYDNGLPNTELKYEKDTTAGAGKYAVSVDGSGNTIIELPTDATDSVQIKYEFQVTGDKKAARVDEDATSFPKECKATFRVLCSDVCDSETVRAFYLVFPKFQMSPDFDWTLDTESAQPFSAVAMKDYCAANQLLFYVAIVEDSDEYDAKTK